MIEKFQDQTGLQVPTLANTVITKQNDLIMKHIAKMLEAVSP